MHDTQKGRRAQQRALSDLNASRRWLPWKQDGDSKPPIGSSTNPRTWRTRSEIRGDRIGIVLGDIEGLHLAGIDLDGVLDDKERITEPIVREIVDRFKTYTEISIGGNGLHLLFFVSDAKGIRNRPYARRGLKKEEVSLWIDGKYFAVTEERFADWSIREVGHHDLEWFINYAGPKYQGKPGVKGTPHDPTDSGWLKQFMWERIQEGDNYDKARAAAMEDPARAGDHLRKQGDDVKPERAARRAWEQALKWKRPQGSADSGDALEALAELFQDDEKFLVPLDEIEETEIEWVWPSFIQKETVSICEGEGAMGKSRLARYVAAYLSSGRELPGATRLRPCNVIIASFSEDAPESVIRPQVRVEGGNLKKVFIIYQPFTLNKDGAIKLAQAIEETRAKIVILDPLADYIPSKADSFRDEQVRRYVMGPLSRIARHFGCSVVAIRHFRKSTDGPLKYRGSGSIGFSNVARCTVAFVEHPHETGVTVIGPTKTSGMHHDDRQNLRFTIVKSEDKVGRLVWDGESDMTVQELADEARQAAKMSTKGPSLLEQAVDFLQLELKKGPMFQEELQGRADARSFSWSTLRNAARNLGVKISGGHKGTKSTWSLP
jgi:hypothetical protein